MLFHVGVLFVDRHQCTRERIRKFQDCSRDFDGSHLSDSGRGSGEATHCEDREYLGFEIGHLPCLLEHPFHLHRVHRSIGCPILLKHDNMAVGI